MEQSAANKNKNTNRNY